MKRILILAMVLLLLLSCVGCELTFTYKPEQETTTGQTDTTGGGEQLPESTPDEQTQPQDPTGQMTEPETTGAPGETEDTQPQPDETTAPAEDTPDTPAATAPQPDKEQDTPAATQPQPEEEPELPAETENPGDAGCNHNYQQTYTKAATCTAKGSKKFTCTKCGATTRQEIPVKDHTYKAATCTVPKTCTSCSKTEGTALGHSYGTDHLCIRCKVKDSNVSPESMPVDFAATVRSDEGDAISGITVTVYTAASGSSPVGSAVTDKNGKVTIALSAGSSKYTVKLSNIPEGYEGKESYTYSMAQVSINLKSLPVRTDPNDHSRARYAEGDKMMEFTMTDVDGRTYKLSELLQEKKLVILDFWYVDCNPCKGEFPYFEAALQKYGDDIVLLAIDPYYSVEDIKELRDDMGITFPLFQDPLGMAEGFRVTAFPTTVFIDSTGTIRTIHSNAYSSEAAFLRAVESYL